VTSLETAIRRVPGAEHVSVNLATEWPMINCNADLTNLHALAQAIDEAGYQVRGFSSIALATN
jgi:copper chaperone CopZ